MTTRDAGRERLARVGLAPRGLDHLEAAAYIGVSESTFDLMIAQNAMPPPRAIFGRLVWDRLELDKAFDALPHKIVKGHAPAAAGTGPDETAPIWARARA